MSTVAVLGEGSSVVVTIGVTPTTILELKTVTFPDITLPAVDTTHMASTYREHLIGTVDNGSLSFTANYDYAVYSILEAAAIGRTTGSWVAKTAIPITGHSEGTWTFNGFITSLSCSAPDVDGRGRHRIAKAETPESSGK